MARWRRDLAAAIFDVGIAFHAAHLVFHFLLGHAQRTLDAESLVDVIDDRQDQQQNADAHSDGENHVGTEAEDLQVGELLNGDDLSEPAGDGGPADEGDESDLEKVQKELRGALAESENFVESASGIEGGEIDGEALGAEIQADLREVDDDDDEHGSGQKRYERDGDPGKAKDDLLCDVLGAEIGQRCGGEKLENNVAEREDQGRSEPFHHQQSTDEESGTGEIVAARDIPLLVGFRFCAAALGLRFYRRHFLP